jgi:hypothetical protein
MSITRVKGTGWALNEEITSAQISAVDVNTARAIDKTTAGDTVAGPLVFSGGSASCSFATGTTLTMGSGSTCALASASMTIDAASTVTMSGTTTIPYPGILQTSGGGGGGGIIKITGANAALVTQSGGRIVLTDNDYPVLGGGHTGATRTVLIPMSALIGVETSGFDQTSNHRWWTTTATSGVVVVALPRLAQGSTLTAVDALFRVNGSHSGYPTSGTGVPNFALTRSSYPVGSVTPVEENLSSTANQYYSPLPASQSGWIDSSNTKRLVYTCNQNNAVDLSTYAYYLTIRDESGTGSFAGNQYLGLVLHYTIADLRPA